MPLPLNRWTFVAVTRSGVHYSLFVGAPDAGAVATVTTLERYPLHGRPRPFRVGARLPPAYPRQAQPHDPFVGTLSRLLVLSRAADAAELAFWREHLRPAKAGL